MKIALLALASLLAASAAWGQRYKPTINAETPEGAQLQAIGQEPDAAKKIALMEKFTAEFPKHEGAPWVYSQMIPAYIAAGDMAKTSAAGERLLALQPDDLESAVTVLRGYEKVKDPAAVMKWSSVTTDLAKKIEAQPKPAGAEEEKTWKDNQDYAKQVRQYAGYALMNQASQATDLQQSIDCVNTIGKLDPQNPYLSQAASIAMVKLQQAGQPEKAAALAEGVLAKDPSSEQMLLVAANYNMTKQQNDKALGYATKLVEVMNTKPKPPQVSEEDWTKTRNTMLGAGNWIAGMIYAAQNKLSMADKSLRDALPLLTDDGMKGGALYQLGFANFKMGEAAGDQKRIQEGFRFSQQSAAIKGQYQAAAAKNVAAIRAKYKVSAAK